MAPEAERHGMLGYLSLAWEIVDVGFYG